MDRDQAREEVKKYIGDYLRSQGLPVNKKFICLNPEHTEKNPSMSLDPNANKVHCFSCGATYDLIDLIKLHEGIDTAEAFKRAYELYNIQIDQEKTAPKDNIAYYRKCMERLKDTDYLKKRGISEEAAKRFLIGFEPHFKTADNGSFTEWKALIIPTGRNSFVARNTDPKAEDRNRYRNKGTSELFNSKALTDSKRPIFIVEGEIDALSIISLGAEAIGLGSTTNTKKLLEELKKEKVEQPLILSLDQDGPGRKAEKELAEGLTALNVPFCRKNINGKCKDANERLLADPEGMKEEIELAERIAADPEELKKEEEKAAEEERKKDLEELQKESAAYYMQDFINGITKNANTSFISTGFMELDKVLEGGLYEGLYIIGAISSLGKTTLVLQIADQIAQQGQNVVIISLEMARAELMAKSISRLTFMECLNTGEDRKYAKTNRGITTGKRYVNYSDKEKNLIKKAMSYYNNYANNIYIYEGVGDIGTEQIRETAKRFKEITGNAPVIIVDYLQIIAPADIRASDKSNIDTAVKELKRISRDYKTPVIAISSLNRTNYNTKISMEAFKESGAIEYSSDVLIGLQLEGVGRQSNFELDKAKTKTPREIELIILKNRNGATNKIINYRYYQLFNYFQEAAEPKYNKETNTYTV